MFCLCSDMLMEWYCFCLDPRGHRVPLSLMVCKTVYVQHQGLALVPGQLSDIRGCFSLSQALWKSGMFYICSCTDTELGLPCVHVHECVSHLCVCVQATRVCVVTILW